MARMEFLIGWNYDRLYCKVNPGSESFLGLLHLEWNYGRYSTICGKGTSHFFRD